VPPAEQLRHAIGDRPMLLVLDNCEHLVDACAALADALLRDCGALRVLATSRAVLGVSGETAWLVPPLSLPVPHDGAPETSEAVQLFVERARAVKTTFALTGENRASVVQICRQLDGLPLALELAAARAASLGLATVRDNLHARLRLLSAGSGGRPARHQTLRATLEWSYNLLRESQRVVFRQLGVFAGGFTLELAKAVAGNEAVDEWEVVDHLSALVEKSLVVAEDGETPRYRMLESARAFALDQLVAAGETADAQRRHALAIADLVRTADDLLHDFELRFERFASLLLPEVDNLRAAYAWASGRDGDLSTAVTLAAHAQDLEGYVEFGDWLLQLRPRIEEQWIDELIAARYWRALASVSVEEKLPFEERLDAARQARSLYDKLGHPKRALGTLLMIAAIQCILGHPGAAASLDECASLLRPDTPGAVRRVLLRNRAVLPAVEGRLDDAIAAFGDVIVACRDAGDWVLEMNALTNLLDLIWRRGPIERASREADLIVERIRNRPGSPADTAMIYANAVGIWSEAGRLDDASKIARESVEFARRAQRLRLEQWIHLAWRRGRIDAATQLLGVLEAEVERSGYLIQPNEQRLLDAARPALEAAQRPAVFAERVAQGRALPRHAVYVLAEEALCEAEGWTGQTVAP
jgi:predicted ATPase